MQKKVKTGGRKLGTPNKTTNELRELINELVSNEIDFILNNLSKLTISERIEVTLKLLPYSLSKLQPSRELESNDNTIIWIEQKDYIDYSKLKDSTIDDIIENSTKL
jgi:hypothetical protein